MTTKTKSTKKSTKGQPEQTFENALTIFCSLFSKHSENCLNHKGLVCICGYDRALQDIKLFHDNEIENAKVETYQKRPQYY